MRDGGLHAADGQRLPRQQLRRACTIGPQQDRHPRESHDDGRVVGVVALVADRCPLALVHTYSDAGVLVPVPGRSIAVFEMQSGLLHTGWGGYVGLYVPLFQTFASGVLSRYWGHPQMGQSFTLTLGISGF